LQTVILQGGHPLITSFVRLQGMTKEDFKGFMAVDKKVLDGALRLILLRGPLGSCAFTSDYDPAALEATLDSFCA
jgi:3-dehydroquinate synthase